jgi:response regulator RpfG family c-di-GMP phosphodiesterase
MHATGNLRILDRLVSDGLISSEQRERALQVVQTMDERYEEALIDIHAVEEPALLKYLATHYKTRFVSTDKLAKADIDRHTLEKIPRKLAEHHVVFPVLFDRKSGVLSVVTPDPDDAGALHELQLASGVKEIRPFVGRPRAVKAAIAKNYGGDIHAFANIDSQAHEQFTSMLNVYERNLVSDDSLTSSLATDEGRRERVLSAEDLKRGSPASSRGPGGFSSPEYLETLNVLVSLVENSRGDLRGHSAHVARFIRKLAERIGVSEIQSGMITLAGYIHDLGKMGAYHLTSLNVSEYEAHQSAAEKTVSSPIRMLESVGLPPEAKEALTYMYERFDGKGFPEGIKGKDIPLGARLLAIADTYADLTQNPRNPFRQKLRPVQACEVLARYKGTIFDPNLVDLFKITVTGDDVKARLLANRYRALVVDSDPEESTVLELRLIEQGFEVQQAHATDIAFKILDRAKGEVDIVIAELDLKPNDGFALLAEVRKRDWGKKLPWVVVTGRSGRTDAQKAFELGAADYMTKPVSSDLLVTKVKQVLEREAAQTGRRGVSGSLTEMGLPDMVQVLWHGRKTGALKIRSGGESGEIHFVKGMIFNAMWSSLRGEEAFYALLKLTEGEFSVDPNFEAPQQVIQASPEALLLEGMRRLDEEGR